MNPLYKSQILIYLNLLIFPNCLSAQKKNVLFIAVDDLKPVLGCYGDSVIETPNIDKLASQGIIFTNTHCQQAVCAPSRASLMTGLRPDVTLVWDLETKIRDKNPDILTLPQYFIKNGYFCSGVGKIFDRRSVDTLHDTLSWSEPYSFDGDEKHYDPRYGIPVFSYYQLPETKREVERLMQEAIGKGLQGFAVKAYAMQTIKPLTECADLPDNAYPDGVLALSAIDRLQRIAQQDKPFFLAIGFKRPHLPFVAPKKYWDLYKREDMPLAKFQKAAENSPSIAYHNSFELRTYTDFPPLISKDGVLPEEKQKELIHGYYASVSYIDAMVGNVIKSLDSLGLRDNTIIVLWGDHGWHLGDHGLWGKHTNLEEATRSPLIFSSPEIIIKSSNNPVEFVDIFPTLCEMTGIEIPENLDGESMFPIMTGLKSKTKNYAVSQFSRRNIMGYSFRSVRYRYVVWLKDNYRSTLPFNSELVVAEELYDYENDPLETVNCIDDDDYRDVTSQMRAYSFEFFESEQNIK
jgi:iduronate 2-sulfatase